jgi:hypothetical protein
MEMESDPLPLHFAQPPLFDFGDSSASALELFPATWAAAEALASPDLAARRAGLDRLVELGAPRYSPLVAYLIATRLLEPDLALREQVIAVLAGVLTPDESGKLAPEPVRQVLAAYLSQMRTRPIVALLQVAESSETARPSVAALLNACPYAGGHLANILNDRRAPLATRRQAVHFVAEVGYLQAVPALERLENRLAVRQNGQQDMPFLPSGGLLDESSLLPEVQSALRLLRTP